ncbi:hypothetical protein DICVIV_06414 [Dictyocaulus viviparus]|uniref:Uncharacterized protein n=1 Tax=Dictyocaulus viviparus TaxID=29172 RepID=A0A0D8XYP1_DICVI|nr:hypothetical protein DICVIV_06414 [Dictyocaulus viviparus]
MILTLPFLSSKAMARMQTSLTKKHKKENCILVAIFISVFVLIFSVTATFVSALHVFEVMEVITDLIPPKC